MIEDYVKKNGYELIDIFKDEAISGGSIKNRPGIIKVLNALKPGYQVVSYSLSRLTRNFDDAFILKHIIEEKGKAELVFLDTLNIKSGNVAMDKFTYGLFSLLSNLEKDQVSERTSKVLTDLSVKGKLRSKARFGWKYIGKGLPFVKDEDEQKTIEYIRYLRESLNAPTLNNIQKKLEASNHKPRSVSKSYDINRNKKIKKDGEVEKISNYGKGGWRANQIKKIMIDNNIPLLEKEDFYQGYDE